MSANLHSIAHRAAGAWRTPLPDRLREVDLNLAADRARVVDVEEIAAYLEADGLSDEALRTRYGTAGLFDAAEQLYRQRGTGRALNRRTHVPVPVFPWKRVLRGPLYLLPGLAGLLLARTLGPGATDAFVFAAMFGWGWTTILASLRYADPLAVPGRAMRLALAVGAVVGTVGGALSAALLPGLPEGGWSAVPPETLGLGAVVGGAVALAAGAAGVLLSLHRTFRYLGAFASPLLAAGVVFVSPSTKAALIALALLALMPLLSALNATRPAGTFPATWATLRAHLPQAVTGWMQALVFVLLTTRLGAWTLLPLVLGTGLLEGAVWHVQERLQRLARLSGNLGRLRRAGSPTVLLAAVAFGLVLAGIAYILPRLPLSIPARPDAWVFVGVYGAAMLLTAWLANHRRPGVLSACWALGAVLLLTLLSTASLPALTTVMAVLCAVLAALVLHAAHDPRSYR
ncbi:hypothetical protein [Deinococcus sp.]|uniref:hypothetical protein n=1 Tax=Deinococcus sp. TaxID=47478 RepID=UPI002869BA48|nr:hypothetical protein [Deinococcus sp.]